MRGLQGCSCHFATAHPCNPWNPWFGSCDSWFFHPGPPRRGMAPRALLLVLLLAPLAGCLGGPAPAATGAHPGGWALDCTLGAFEAANRTWVQPCEARASHT